MPDPAVGIGTLLYWMHRMTGLEKMEEVILEGIKLAFSSSPTVIT